MGVKPELPGQVFGYWLAPGARPSRRPVGRPTGALLPARENTFDDPELVCLDLVPVQNYWLVLSEAGRYTYNHSSGLLFDKDPWLFVPVPEAVGGSWPVVFHVSYDKSIEHALIAERYGAEASRRARRDVAAVQLKLRLQPRPRP